MPSPEINNPEDARREFAAAGMRAAHAVRVVVAARAALKLARRALDDAESEATAADADLRSAVIAAAHMDQALATTHDAATSAPRTCQPTPFEIRAWKAEQ